MQRAVVTGIGVICSIGRNLAEFAEALREGRDGSTPIENAQDWELRFTSAAQVRNYDPTDHFAPKEADMLDRFAQFAVVAAREAVKQSGIWWTPDLRESSAVVTGSCIGGQTTEDRGF